MLKKLRVLVTALALVLAIPGSVGAGRVTVKADNGNFGYSFKPYKTVIPKGTKVVWKNVDIEEHTIKSHGAKKFVWGNKSIMPGEKFVKRFKKRGLYYYFCNIHGAVIDGECSGMCGKVKVRRPSG